DLGPHGSPRFVRQPRHGQDEGERRTLPDAALHLDASAVRFGDFARDGQPEAGPPNAAGAGLVDAVEAVEDSRQVLSGDAGPGVSYLEHGLITALEHVQRDLAATRRIAQSVVDQVEHDLLEP